MEDEMTEISAALEKDAELVGRLNRGDQLAFTMLYDKYVDMVYGFLYRLLKDEQSAEDITQFCFMQVWIHRKKISGKKSLPAYLYVMARNAAYKEFRKQLLAASYLDSSIHEEGKVQPADYGKTDLNLIRKEISRCIGELPEARRQIYIMSRFEGMKSSEIAEKLGISTSTVDVQISRAKHSLRIALSKIFVLITIASM